MNASGKDRINLTDWDRECMAWHEAGHAVCANMLPEGTPVLRVSIVPDDEAFGLMLRVPRPHHNETERSLRSSIGIFLAGCISERLFLDRKTTSLSDDLRVANQIARDMTLRFGMGRRTGWLCLLADAVRSDGFLRDADADMRDILDESSREVENVLRSHGESVKALAYRLLSEGTVSHPLQNARLSSS